MSPVSRRRHNPSSADVVTTPPAVARRPSQLQRSWADVVASPPPVARRPSQLQRSWADVVASPPPVARRPSQLQRSWADVVASPPAVARRPSQLDNNTENNLKQGNLFSLFSRKPAPVATSAAKPSTSVAKPSASTRTVAAVTATSFSHAPAPTIATENSSWKSVRVGDRIGVWWADDCKYYPAKVQACRSNQFSLLYDDGESEWTDLSEEKFQILNVTRKRCRSFEEDDDVEELYDSIRNEEEAEFLTNDTFGEVSKFEGKSKGDHEEDRNYGTMTGGGGYNNASNVREQHSDSHQRNDIDHQSAVPTTPPRLDRAKFRVKFGASKATVSVPIQPFKNTKDRIHTKGAHIHNEYEFLRNPRDAQMRRHDDPGYDPRTLYMGPSDWGLVNDNGATMLQWWKLKCQYFDTIILFQIGNFYHLYHMDADVGHEVLSFSYQKGRLASVSFPQPSLGKTMDKLVEAGYKVTRVQTTEGTDPVFGVGVLNREVCNVVSLGTRTSYCMFEDESEETCIESRLLAIAETSVLVPTMTLSQEDDMGSQPVWEYGITMIDAVRGTVFIGQFADDVLQSRMRTLLARKPPNEILISDTASPDLQRLVTSYIRHTGRCRMEVIASEESFPTSTALDPCHRQRLERRSQLVHPWDSQETLDELHRRGYYPRGSKSGAPSIQRWPKVLRTMVEENADLGLMSFGAAMFYLQRHLIDVLILTTGIINAYTPEACVKLTTGCPNEPFVDMPETATCADHAVYMAMDGEPFANMPETITCEDHVDYMAIDGTTLYNLEVLRNSITGKTAGSLWSVIDHCTSAHGRRHLKSWLLRPLFHKAAIDRRVDAVQELAQGGGVVALEALRKLLGRIPDLDRLLSRVHGMSGSNGNHDPNQRVILHESATHVKRKLANFSKAFRSLRLASQIPEALGSLDLIPGGLLTKLVKYERDGGLFPDLTELLDWFSIKFDMEKIDDGVFEPSLESDPDYYEACATMEEVTTEILDYRREMCQRMNLSPVYWKYINITPQSKDKFFIELPATVQVPDDFWVKWSRGSGVKRVIIYESSVVTELVKELEEAIQIQEVCRDRGMQLMFSLFDSKQKEWRRVAIATGALDALCSLAKVAQKPGFCRPTILDCPLDQPPCIDIVQGRHPCVDDKSVHIGRFIPNDLRLGGTPTSDDQDAARLLLLSGPNMGGKSTLLRQTCLIAILAQMGSYVPAESCSLTPVDCIYTRLGASDRILLGQSTFFVELAETAAALRGATRRSLVIMDELGRGTSTFDGTAIAGATVKHLVQRNQCLTLFATHYHSLLDEWKNESSVRLGHMQCLVEHCADDTAEHSITFLYTLGPGTCPGSFGINVARLAGLPEEVLENADRISQEFENEMREDDAVIYKARVMAAIESEDWEEVERLWTELQHSELLHNTE